MRVYHDQDADLSPLRERRTAIVGYGNQGRAQALNLRDSGLEILIGNREDEYAARARKDGFPVLPLSQAVEEADIVVVLLPDEVMPELFDTAMAPGLSAGDVLVFASGYSVAFGLIEPPAKVDVVLVAPRMIGAGVRDLYVAGRGFPAFVGVAQDHSGQAKEIALALARGIGATRAGVVEVTFAQEAELDLFTEQCFGPAFGQVLTTAVHLLLDEGYPPEAVLLELYMSGELAYTLAKIAELGMLQQTRLHSRTSQYGSLSRGMRFMLPELRGKMHSGLEEIRSGTFAREWAEEQAAGCPTLNALQEAARSLPLYQLERELRHALGARSAYLPPKPDRGPDGDAGGKASKQRLRDRLRGRLRGRLRVRRKAPSPRTVLAPGQLEQVVRQFVAHAGNDPALKAFARDHRMTVHYVVCDGKLEFHMDFGEGVVGGGLGPPASGSDLRLTVEAELLDSMLTGQTNAMRAALTGRLTFEGNARQAMALQRIQDDLIRIYSEARQRVTGRGT
jgi:ketol-acid reductoisomerase